MLWETERYDWSKLRSMGSASSVPQAIVKLQNAASEQEAQDAYWRIDNTVVVQGSLYEAALPAAACAVSALPRCSTPARPWLLELLVQLSTGQPDPIEIQAGNEKLQELCIQAISRGIGMYFDLLENGAEDEREYCVDLLGICAQQDPSLNPRARWYMERLLLEQISSGLRKLTKHWLNELAK